MHPIEGAIYFTAASRKRETLPTENLLEVTDGCGSLRPSMYADVRHIDDVIAIEGHDTGDVWGPPLRLYLVQALLGD